MRATLGQIAEPPSSVSAARLPLLAKPTVVPALSSEALVLSITSAQLAESGSPTADAPAQSFAPRPLTEAKM